MKNHDSWEKFAKSGNIFDYLSYIACTVEDCSQLLSRDNKEGGECNANDGCDGDGFVGHAHWGL
ncbi:hypothetical protein acsn021_07220 [Anaerocolumna cellulosilytica]|uniref:Uncharacterized protein n=1 Tax=Anaerocolumna cellulosilytica TaxID=433286 RepID=A0A6S6QP65_9FIRM|nr:hypothetical protein [Anaerocolumna cellulosilytica]MBB5198016.1 hypothetical protein [Anaerocolumna cellulosilytica]BCJ93153.1 hypothetical protein acsn021_07220 [Anaerocolumna cellulosilytica]